MKADTLYLVVMDFVDTQTLIITMDYMHLSEGKAHYVEI
ncbi:hypothetical protein B4144_0606 [Bacillus atrophaeus]|nr:hypothetical protein B4144_0606 [Bacillus atrophaeus]